MTDIENYTKILLEVFDQDPAFTLQITNNCIGALNNEYSVFNNHFIERLSRLKKVYSSNSKIINEIIVTAKYIGQTTGYKWSGAYSELIALDYWSSCKEIRIIDYPTKSPNLYENSIAKRIGQTQVDIDLEIELLNKVIYTDVKAFIPLHDELADVIINQVSSKINGKKILIGVDNVYDVDYLRVKKDLTKEIKGSLITKLISAIQEEEKIVSHLLDSGEKINFRIEYPDEKGGVLTTTREINAYKLANDYKMKILSHYNKFLLHKSSLITWVINPWFNKEFNDGDQNFRLTVLRSLCRRIFMELKNDTSRMSSYFSDFTNSNDMTVSEISKLISGIVFIFDNSVTAIDHNDLYESYIYLNPNSKAPLNYRDFSILTWPGNYKTYIDDFQYDNY